MSIAKKRGNKQRSSNISVFFLLFGAVFMWGVGFPISKLGIDYIKPFKYAFLRFFIASLIFAYLLVKKYSVSTILKDLKNNFVLISIMALSGISAYNFFYLYSLKMTLVSNSAMIAAMNPIITALIAAFVLKEKINPVMAAGICVSFFGTLIIVSGGSAEAIKRFSFNTGDLFMLVATFLWAIYTVAGKIAMRKMPFMETVALAAILGSIYLIPFVINESGKDLFNLAYPPIAWMSVLYMSVMATVFAFSIWYKGVQYLGASKTSVFVNLVPVFGVLASSIILKEMVKQATLAGGLLIIIGVIITNRAKA